ncbi:SPY3 protein, partial [Turnix velox]|nr:SPY3 protein [Turnix velox]
MDPPPSEDFPQQVLSIQQIRSIRATNNYVERPAVAATTCCQQTRSNPSLSQPHLKQEWPQDLLASSSSHGQQHPVPPQHLSHSSTASSLSRSTTASDQRLLGSITPSHSGHSIARGEAKAEESPVKEGVMMVVEGDKPPVALQGGGHLLLLCEECGRCKCGRCTAARGLPSCWLCNQRCLCSPDSLLDYGTCLCCVKGIFYHCSTDDEDTCADEPCSCGPGSCCARWAAMSFLSLLMPCLCCYFPTLGCLKLCQRGYDGLKRPGCRCHSHTNTVCRKISSSSPPSSSSAHRPPFPKTLEKPV